MGFQSYSSKMAAGISTTRGNKDSTSVIKSNTEFTRAKVVLAVY